MNKGILFMQNGLWQFDKLNVLDCWEGNFQCICVTILLSTNTIRWSFIIFRMAIN